MKNHLNVTLKKTQESNELSEMNAQVVLKGNVGVSRILDELINDGIVYNRDHMLKVIMAFNQKVAELAVSGYMVNTGLVKLSPNLTDAFNEENMHDAQHSLEIELVHGIDLRNALAETDIQLVDNQQESAVIEPIEDSTIYTDNIKKNNNDKYINDHFLYPNAEPPCGMAFRRWLFKSDIVRR
jgi:hypothetical protein